MITVANLHSGNLTSLGQALLHLRVPYVVSSKPEDLTSASAVILPGVGHYGFAVRQLDSLGLRSAICDAVRRGTPILGICLGMQLLFEESDESGPDVRGLALIRGGVKSLRALGIHDRVPHVGWNSLIKKLPYSRLLDGVMELDDVYFVHSYAAQPFKSSVTSATCIYDGVEIVAAVEDRNVYGVQFHPEKSSTVGRRILRNFVEHVC